MGDDKILTPKQEITALESSVFTADEEAEEAIDTPATEPETEEEEPNEDTPPAEEGEEDAEAEEGQEDEEGEADTSDDPAPLFSKEQQTEVNRIVQSRLDRAEQKLLKDLTNAAGISIEQKEITSAARLWGLLKHNPTLSGKIDQLIADSLRRGEAKPPVLEENTTEVATKRLAFKESVLDLRQADATFNKNADKILAWADKEGYTVSDAKSLKMAYLAWKGSQDAVKATVQKTVAQKKQQQKQTMQQKAAAVQSPKRGNVATKPVDFRKMTDAQILAAQGLKLFIEE